MRLSPIVMVTFILAMTPACTQVADVDLGYSDILANAGSGDVQDTVQATNELRESSVLYFFLERWLERYADYVLVESINEQDELHRFVLVADFGSGYELVTNIGLPPSVTGPDAPLPGDVLVYGVADSPERARLFGIASQSLTAGVGGLADVDDGDSHFLTQSAGSADGKSVLYGVSFPPLDDDPDLPAEPADTGRYEAMEAIYAFWADALARSQLPSVVIATTP